MSKSVVPNESSTETATDDSDSDSVSSVATDAAVKDGALTNMQPIMGAAKKTKKDFDDFPYLQELDSLSLKELEALKKQIEQHHYLQSKLKKKQTPSFQAETDSGMEPIAVRIHPLRKLYIRVKGAIMDVLYKQKRQIKIQLKQFDMDFVRKNGRMPTREEKEPIRRKYEHYNSIKAQIKRKELENLSNCIEAWIQPKELEDPSNHIMAQPKVKESDDSSSHTKAQTKSKKDSESPGNHTKVKPKVKRDSEKPSPDSDEDSSWEMIDGHVVDVPSSLGEEWGRIVLEVGTEEMATLKKEKEGLRKEKGELHQMLRAYEKEFFKKHGRKVSLFNDIEPLVSEYHLYKAISKSLGLAKKPSKKKKTAA